MANVADASAAGLHVLTVTHSSNTDAAAARYGYASALLASRGRVAFASVGDYHTETWFRDYERDLGAPTGPDGDTAGRRADAGVQAGARGGQSDFERGAHHVRCDVYVRTRR